MNPISNFKAAVAGTGSYLPDRILTNYDLENSINTSDEWIFTRTGIKERRIAAENESASTMAVGAAKKALKSANVSPDQVDMIIVCTSTPDVLFPSTACFVQKELEAFNSAAYDISAVCSGFIFGLSIAEQYLKAGRYEHILVIGSEVNSRIVDWSDRSTCILFGDGAGAVLLKRMEQTKPVGILSSHIYSDGSLTDLISVPGGIGKSGINKEDIEKKNYFIKINKFNTPIGTGSVMNTNDCRISICENREKNKVIILSAIDNLIKGGSGQAVQNMNMYYGFNEKLGFK